MDSIIAPSIDGTFQTLYGREYRGLFLQSLEPARFLFRHSSSGLSLFYATGTQDEARALQENLVQLYNFQRDSTWVLKGQGELHLILQRLGLNKQWRQRAWHYELVEGS